jgi:hypothetical protein
MPRRSPGAGPIVAGLLALASVIGCGSSTGDRAADVAAHSREVMPFDLTRATHTFSPTDTGLVETVVTRSPVDTDQVALIRRHLAAEASAFQAGDFSDPAKIHGDDMPGLATLDTRADRLTVAYLDVAGGGRITYTSTDPAVIDALHDFGSVQASDHDHEHAHN